jgi:hypothetical protein
MEKNKARYELKDMQLYDQYRTTKTTDPMYLFILVLPRRFQATKWFACTPSALTMKGCAYWVSLYGAPDSQNNDSVTITIERKNRVTPVTLRKMITDFAMTEKMVPYAED